ncbi:CBS domain-containing protein [bacterium]|nr:CBS domain-containing protein [bacterium]
MKQREPISKIMTDHVITVNLHNSLEEASDLFKKHHIRHLPVVSGHKLVGMLSLTDLKRLSFYELSPENDMDDDDETATTVYRMFTIEQVMVSNPVTVSVNSTIKEVAEILAQIEFHALPVVSEANELAGIITTTDMIKFLLEQY